MNLHTLQQTPELLIFFDESGKQGNEPVLLMGGISIPSTIYHHENYKSLHKLNSEYNYHWTAYGGDSKMRNGIELLFSEALPLANYVQLNFIRYFKSQLTQQAKPFSGVYESKQEIVSDTIYTKLPERICYGLLREFGENNHIRSTILVEDANEYRSKNLANNIKHYLNIHSLYRGEAFVVQQCNYRRKKEEIGVELTDILLGIVSTILENPIATASKRNRRRFY